VSAELVADCYAHAGIRLPLPSLARPA
jgi:hypothetical protein